MFSLLHFKSLRQRMFDLLQMEWFPAGHGAVLSAAGYVQLDAIITNGWNSCCQHRLLHKRISKPVTFACFSQEKVEYVFLLPLLSCITRGFWQGEQIKYSDCSTGPWKSEGVNERNVKQNRKSTLKLVISVVH